MGPRKRRESILKVRVTLEAGAICAECGQVLRRGDVALKALADNSVYHPRCPEDALLRGQAALQEKAKKKKVKRPGWAFPSTSADG
jgi:hypothetical protein